MLTSAPPAQAQGFGGTSTTDPLHAFCIGTTCSSQSFSGGSVLTTTNNPQSFGFYKTPGGGGSSDFLLEVLVPNNEIANPGTIFGTNTANSSASGILQGSGAWSSGSLASFLNISANPSNPISALLGATLSVDPGATGYDVYQYDFGRVSFGTSSGGSVPPDPAFTAGSVPTGTVFLGFAHGDDGYVATANSEALAELGSPTAVPEPTSFALFGSALLGLVLLQRQRRSI
jgi:hypothetical protein